MTMPQLSYRSGAAAGSYQPLTGWAYEFLPWPARVKVLTNNQGAVVAGAPALLQVFSGSEVIQESSPVPNQSTPPSDLNTPAIEFLAPAGDRLKLLFARPNATDDIAGTIYVHPVG
jgi:hypothetical protein